MNRSLIPVVCALLASSAVAHAQLKRPRAEVTPLVEHESVAAGSPLRAALKVALPEGLHTQSNKPRDPLLIPTELTIDAPATVTVDEVAGRRPDDFIDRDGRRRVDGELGGNQQRIARLVRLRVQPLGQRDLQRCAERRAGGDTLVLDERRDLGARTPDLSGRGACEEESAAHRERD